MASLHARARAPFARRLPPAALVQRSYCAGLDVLATFRRPRLSGDFRGQLAGRGACPMCPGVPVLWQRRR